MGFLVVVLSSFFLVPLGGVLRLKLETGLLVLVMYGVFGGGPEFFFFFFPLGGVFRLKLETCFLVLEKYGFWGCP